MKTYERKRITKKPRIRNNNETRQTDNGNYTYKTANFRYNYHHNAFNLGYTRQL